MFSSTISRLLSAHQFAIAAVARKPLGRLVWLSPCNITKFLCHFRQGSALIVAHCVALELATVLRWPETDSCEESAEHHKRYPQPRAAAASSELRRLCHWDFRSLQPKQLRVLSSPTAPSTWRGGSYRTVDEARHGRCIEHLVRDGASLAPDGRTTRSISQRGTACSSTFNEADNSGTEGRTEKFGFRTIAWARAGYASGRPATNFFNEIRRSTFGPPVLHWKVHWPILATLRIMNEFTTEYGPCTDFDSTGFR
eukprot:COSAG02_NODE_4514_length_5276_cov_1.972571_4_plen_254_part_00